MTKAVGKASDDVVTELVIRDMGRAAFEIRVCIRKSNDPVGEGDIMRLTLNNLVDKLVLPVARKPLGLEFGHELIEGQSEEGIVVGFDPGDDVVAFEAVHDPADLALGGNTFGLEYTIASDAKASNALEADGPNAKQGIAIGAGLRDDGVAGLVGRRHSRGGVRVVRVKERVGVRVLVNVLRTANRG